MPFVLHPSGFCCHYSGDDSNLLPGVPCVYCGRVAGHDPKCPKYQAKQGGTSSRSRVFDCVAVLWAKSPVTNFITFTLPTLKAGKYQGDPADPVTGDKAIAAKFSKVLEAFALRTKRAGGSLSYVWVSEAQTKRGMKYGGPGDLHYHLVANVQIKNERQRVADLDTLQWLQNLWCEHVGAWSNNCVHVDYLPPDIRTIPAYMSKYFNKGASRVILSRRFGASADVSKYRPVTLSELPDVDLSGQKDYTTPDGYEVTAYYFNSRQVLEQYGGAMADAFYTSKANEPKDPNFTPAAITSRAIRRQIKEFGLPDGFIKVDVTPTNPTRKRSKSA